MRTGIANVRAPITGAGSWRDFLTTEYEAAQARLKRVIEAADAEEYV